MEVGHTYQRRRPVQRATATARSGAAVAARIVGVARREGDALAELFHARLDDPRFTEDGLAGVVPLPVLYREQPHIGTELVRQRSVIDTSRLRPGALCRVVLVIFVRYPIGFVR